MRITKKSSLALSALTVESFEINFLQYKYGAWDFPTKEDIQIIELKLIFMEPRKAKVMIKCG